MMYILYWSQYRSIFPSKQKNPASARMAGLTGVILRPRGKPVLINQPVAVPLLNKGFRSQVILYWVKFPELKPFEFMISEELTASHLWFFSYKVWT